MPALARGEPVRLLPGPEGPSFEVHAVIPSHRSLSAKVRVLIDALATAMRPASGARR